MAETALVFKVGGSMVINEQGANTEYLADCLSPFIDVFSQFDHLAFVIGGGIRVRILQKTVSSDAEKDEVGIRATHEHADQLRQVLLGFGLRPASTIPTSPDEAKQLMAEEPCVVMGGLQIGQSTDAVAAFAFHRFCQAGYDAQLILLSNVDHIYTADPKKDAQAKPIYSADIDDLVRQRVLINDPQEWIPGMNITIDPVAVGLLQRTRTNRAAPIFFTGADNAEGIMAFLGQHVTQSGTTLSLYQQDK